MRGERIAPIFDGTRARDLPRSFLDIERLFRRAKKLQSNITDSDTDADHNISVTNLRFIYLPSATDNQLSNSNHLSTDKKITRAVKIVVVIGVPIFMLALGLVLEIAIIISNLKDGSYLL